MSLLCLLHMGERVLLILDNILFATMLLETLLATHLRPETFVLYFSLGCCQYMTCKQSEKKGKTDQFRLGHVCRNDKGYLSFEGGIPRIVSGQACRLEHPIWFVCLFVLFVAGGYSLASSCPFFQNIGRSNDIRFETFVYVIFMTRVSWPSPVRIWHHVLLCQLLVHL